MLHQKKFARLLFIMCLLFLFLSSCIDQQNSPIAIERATTTSTATAVVMQTPVMTNNTTSLPKKNLPGFVYLQTPSENWSFYSPKTGGLSSPITVPGVTEIASNGDVWFSNGNAISKFDGTAWTTYTIPDELLTSNNAPTMQASAMVITSDDSVWLGGSNTYSSLFRFDGYQWHKELENVSIRSIAMAQDRTTLWFSVHPTGKNEYVGSFFMPKGGILRFDGVNWVAYTKDDGLINNNVNDITIDKDGVVWLATDVGISSFDGKSWNNYPMMLFCKDCNQKWNANVSHITTATDGSLWFTVDQVALFHYTTGNWERYDNDVVFHDYYPVSRICLSPTGVLWIGKWANSGPQFLSFDGKNWVVPTISGDKKSIPSIHDVKCKNDGSIWMVSLTTGVIHYKP